MAEPITIAVDARTATGAFTGVGRYTVSLLRALAGVDPGLRLLVLAAQGAGAHFADLPEGRVTVRPTRMVVPLHPFSDLWLHLALPLLLRRERIGLLFSTANYLPVVAGGARTVVTIHDMVCFRHPEVDPWTFVVFLKAMLRLAALKADRIVAVSESTAREIVDLLGVPRERVAVVPNGVSPHFRPLSRGELSESALPNFLDVPFVLSVGARIPRKNFRRLIDALTILRERGHPHHLVIAGPPGPSQNELERAVIAHRLTDAVHFVGYPDDRTLVWLYNRAQLFVYPSLYEGFGIPIVEAMACGTPVACSDRSSLPEVAADAALLFDPLSPEAIADACERIITDPSVCRRLVEAGFARSALFTWEAAAARTAEVFRSVLS